MTNWSSLPEEVRALLAPSFVATLLWKAATGHCSVDSRWLPLDLAFLVPPIVLHQRTREELPRTVATSLAVWLDAHALFRALFPERARQLVPFTRDAVIFGAQHGLFTVEGGQILANVERSSRVKAILRGTSEEVELCAKRAEFLGKWFAKAGDSETIMALIGVRP